MFTLRDNQRKSHDRADKFREKHVGADAGGRFVREWFLCRRVQFYRAIFHLSADCASSVGVLPASALHAPCHAKGHAAAGGRLFPVRSATLQRDCTRRVPANRLQFRAVNPVRGAGAMAGGEAADSQARQW
ncbi:hypothetical protein Dda3937_04435 [Dickeya dadantii 3937]|uniref:Uncharacterized protein n=1 Tax=Dickeya dadantii (strain 3937) TaxID=198628 RepID=E0SGD5_DICD3|nr:hypothetical protein Dda3937_04435 [Dickeya dadantii 3937]